MVIIFCGTAATLLAAIVLFAVRKIFWMWTNNRPVEETGPLVSQKVGLASAPDIDDLLGHVTGDRPVNG